MKCASIILKRSIRHYFYQWIDIVSKTSDIFDANINIFLNKMQETPKSLLEPVRKALENFPAHQIYGDFESVNEHICKHYISANRTRQQIRDAAEHATLIHTY